MAKFVDLSDVIAQATTSGRAQHLFFFKDINIAGVAAANSAANRWSSAWQLDGSPAGGAVPGAVAIPDNTTNGGLKQTDPGGGRQLWMTGAVMGSNAQNIIMIYDRLLHIGGLDGTNVGAQTVGGTLTRYTDGVGNQIWYEIYTQIGATARTITASYTDQDGNAGQTSQAVNIGATGYREDLRMLPIGLASGDSGVRAVASVTLSASTGTAGNFGIDIIHPLVYLHTSVSINCAVRNMVREGFNPMEILTDACLAMAFQSAATTNPYLVGSVHMVEK